MKIALIIEDMNPAGGGRERSVAETAVELSARGHEVTVLCRSGDWKPPAPNIKVHQLGRRGIFRYRRAKNFVNDARDHIRKSRGNFHVIHATLPVPGCDVYQPRGGTVPAQRDASRRKRKGPARMLCRAAEPLNFTRCEMAQFEKEVVGDANVACLAVSEMVGAEFERYYARSEGVRVVYNGVGAPQAYVPKRNEWRARIRRQLSLGSDGVLFVAAVKNARLKGVEQTIGSFERWISLRGSRSRGRLAIIGLDSHRMKKYGRMARRTGLERAVKFVPFADNIFQWYAAADVLVHLTWYDPCSRTVLEAIRSGLPSVTTRYNGAAEVLADGAGAVVDSPDDTRAIVEAMNDLCESSGRESASAACRRMAEGLTIGRHVDELLESYRKISPEHD